MASEAIVRYSDQVTPNVSSTDLLFSLAKMGIHIGQALDTQQNIRTKGFWPASGPLSRVGASGQSPVGLVAEWSEDGQLVKAGVLDKGGEAFGEEAAPAELAEPTDDKMSE